MNQSAVNSLFVPLMLAVLACAATGVARAEGTMPFEMFKPGIDVGIVVADMAVAKKFYQDALGLEQQPDLNVPVPGQMVRYASGGTTIKLRTMPTTPPKHERGTQGAIGMRLVTLYVKDIDGLAKRMTANGFTAPRFGEVQPAGYRVAFTNDPDGNQIEFLHYPEGKDDIYQRFQVGLTVKDAEKSREFYGKVLGLEEREPLPMRGGGKEYLFNAGVSTVKFWNANGEKPVRTGAIGDALGIRYFTFLVKDVDAAHTALKAKGVKITTPPRDLGQVARIMLIEDPDGNTIEFAQPKGPR